METTDVFIYGASGHGRVIADILRSCGYSVGGWIDDRPSPDAYSWEDFCSAHPKGSIALGIGDNDARERVFRQVSAAGYCLPILIHPSAVISESATIEEGTVIMPLAIVNAGAVIAKGCIINSGAVVEHDCHLDAFVHLSPRAALAGGVKIGYSTHIGIGASIIQNITIGDHSIIAAGSAVIRDIADHSLAAGVPALIKKSLHKPV
ncbi:MAG: acetyltransferase [Campylobacterales bacterium]|nr:acetyltransferase [Campylobacterales bacterium]